MSSIKRTHQVTIRRKSGAGDLERGGGRVQKYVVAATGVVCNIQPRSGDIRETSFGSEKQSVHRIFFPHATDIQPQDEIEVTSGAYASPYLRAIFVGTILNPWDTEVDCVHSETDAAVLV